MRNQRGSAVCFCSLFRHVYFILQKDVIDFMEQKLFDKTEEAPRAVLVSVMLSDDDEHEIEVSLNELARLLDTAGGSAFACVIQTKSAPDVRTYVGSGKVDEIAELCQNNDVHMVIFDCELSPSQIKNLEDDLSTEKHAISVIDRSMLILDIFALHATTGEGKLQVELAQLKYTAPRLMGRGTELSRLGGGIGTRGPGESKLESDRRHLKRRMAALEEELAVLEKNREIQRRARERSKIFKVAIAGYTNAGKSTLLNRLTGAGILAEDKLFATLDPTTRKFILPSGCEILFTDTVGFIRNLPHYLIKAFKSTLDEVAWADAILLVADASDAECPEQMKVSEQLFAELGAAEKTILYVFNKCDAADVTLISRCRAELSREQAVFVSAKTGEGMENLVTRLEEIVMNGKTRETFVIPNREQEILAQLYKNATVESVDYGADAVTVIAAVDAGLRGKLKAYRAPQGDEPYEEK